MKKLLSRKELIEKNYPYGIAAPEIPLGDEKTEWMRSNPDIVLYKPTGDESYVNDNEHFLVFKAPKSDELLAVWTQSSCEGTGDNHLVMARSNDCIHWCEPEFIAGARPGSSDKQASWGFPVVSGQGRIYLFFTKEMDIYDNNRQGCGSMGCVYSDDNGISWLTGADIPMPRSRYDNPDPEFPKNWIVWQIPARDSMGRYIVGYTLVTSRTQRALPDNRWVNADSRSYFMRFENIDDNPSPEDILISWLPEDDAGLEVQNKSIPDMSTCQEPSIAFLPDGRLFVTMRTMTGYVYYSVSDDGGRTWRRPEMLRYSDGGEGIAHPMSPCPIYNVDDGRFLLIFHNNDGNYMGFSQFKEHWDVNEANFFRNPAYICVGKFMENAHQPVWFDNPIKLFDTDDIAVGPKKTAEIATYTSYTEWKGKRILWYPDRKFYLLGKYITDDILSGNLQGGIG